MVGAVAYEHLLVDQFDKTIGEIQREVFFIATESAPAAARRVKDMKTMRRV